MAMKLLDNIQIIKLREQERNRDWTFQINWLDKSILLYLNQIKLVKFTDCRLPPTTEYLQSLTENYYSTRTLQ